MSFFNFLIYIYIYIFFFFQDLKKYHFYYWCAFPAPTFPTVTLKKQPLKLGNTFSESQVSNMLYYHCSFGQKCVHVYVLGIEVVRRFKYLGAVINDINDETEEIRARILAANKSYSFLQTVFRSKQIHRNNKIILY